MKLPHILKENARNEAYRYFDKNIRSLNKNSDGSIDITAHGLHNNDVDAFRHAYVSGVFTMEYGERNADIFGQLNEFASFASPSPPGKSETNMDLWNNAVGRRYAKGIESREELAKRLHEAFRNGELIVSPDDSRKYKGASNYQIDQDKPVVVIKESKTGRNEIFLDLAKMTIMNRDAFTSAIKGGNILGIKLLSWTVS